MFIITGRFAEFQSALRFAVVSDLEPFFRPFADVPVSIRFKVRGGFRRVWMGGRYRASLQFQSALRFAVVSDPTLLACCPDKPCCGVLTHHSFSPPPTSGQNLSSMG